MGHATGRNDMTVTTHHRPCLRGNGWWSSGVGKSIMDEFGDDLR